MKTAQHSALAVRLYCVFLLSLLTVLFSRHSIAADDLLAELSARSGQLSAISGVFRQQRIIKQLPVALQSNGIFSYSSSNGIEWRTLHPVESTLSISDQGLLIEGSARQTDSTLFARLILSVFLGDVQALEQHFTIEAVGSLSAWRMRLVPATESIALRYSEIKIAGAEFTETLVLNEPGGDVTKIEFFEVSMLAITDGNAQ